MIMSVPRGFIHACAAVLVAVGCAGCGSDTSPSPNVPFSQTDLRIGTGADVANGKTLTVTYSGWLYDSTQPDNKGTLFQTAPSYQFVLGTGAVIAGWDQGILGMKAGGLRRLVIPPNLAYGSAGNPPSIPANATLVFEIGVISVQ